MTLRVLKVHGGAREAGPGAADVLALGRGMENLDKHLESVRAFGIEPVVMVNVRAEDPADEIRLLVDRLRREQVEVAAADVFTQGGEGALDIAARVMARARAASPCPRGARAIST